MARKTLQERLWSRVDKTGECWNWTGYLHPRGYGRIGATSPDGRATVEQAHRVAYADAVGPIPVGMSVDHRCHNRSCCNPDHLRLVTTKQNAEHRLGAQRNNKSSGVRGVHWKKGSKKWQALIRHNQRHVYLGLYETIAEAESVVIAKRLELFTHNDLDRQLV